MRTPFLFALILAYSLTSTVSASSPQSATSKGSFDLALADSNTNELQLEAQKIPMKQVLAAIVAKTHIKLHASVLPEGLVTATCVGTVKTVLECLLDGKADLIVRYPKNVVKNDTNGQVVEAWILGSQFDSNHPNLASCSTNTNPSANTADSKISVSDTQDAAAKEEAERTSELLKLAQSKNSEERANAIGEILALENQNDPNISAVLEQALTDQDSEVRAQAISSYAHRDGVDAIPALQQALHDDSEDVRLMAVDSMTDAGLLQQAASDSDETVRSLAALKLAQLGQSPVSTQ